MSGLKSIAVTALEDAEYLDPTSPWWGDGWAAADESERVQKVRDCIQHAFNVEIALKRERGFIDAFVIPNREWIRKVKPYFSAAYPKDEDRPKNFHLFTGEIRWFRYTILKENDYGNSPHNPAVRAFFFGTASDKTAALRLFERRSGLVRFAAGDIDAKYRAVLVDLSVILAWDHASTSRMKTGRDRVLTVALRHGYAGRPWRMSGHPDLDALMFLARQVAPEDRCLDISEHKLWAKKNPASLAKVVLHVLSNATPELSTWGLSYGSQTSRGLLHLHGDTVKAIPIDEILAEWLPDGQALVDVTKALGGTPDQLLRDMAAGVDEECVQLELPDIGLVL